MLKSKHAPLTLAKDNLQEIIKLRRDFHMHPEIGFEVHRTAGIVAQELERYGHKVKTGVGKTGVVADLTVPGAKRRICFRADMDALPIQEMNDIPYKSRTPMCAHLCGHDAHTAMLLMAAKLLAAIQKDLNVNVRFIFQPCEEVWPGGAPGMIKEGVLDGVDAIYALHVWPTLRVGAYGICVGPAMAQPDGFEISINGKGGHAAAPHSTIDSIVIAAQVIQALQTIVARNLNPNDNAVLSVTQVHAGTCNNVLPDSCSISGTVRTYGNNVQQIIKNRMNEIVTHIAKSYGGTAECKYLEGYPVVYNDEDEAMKTRDMAISLVGKEQVDFPAQKVMLGEDFAYYTQKVKGCFIHLGCRNESKNITRMLHDSRFNIDEDCLAYGTALFLQLALNGNST